ATEAVCAYFSKEMLTGITASALPTGLPSESKATQQYPWRVYGPPTAPHSAITHVEYEAASSSRRGYPELGALIYQIIFSKQCEDIKYSLQKPRHEY
ncbi:MAG: hypothetical protein MR685_11870, partial [Alistipes sp.]|nr:hypothetical protein [Alistipes sp.]